MISVTHFAATDDGFAGRANAVLAALAIRPGYLRGAIARGTDDAQSWLLVTEWRNVGSYRRALGAKEVKLLATPLHGDAIKMPSTFELLVDIAPGGAAVHRTSDRA